MTDTSCKVFFGDSDRVFRITPALLTELEAKRGPIALVSYRVWNHQFAHADITEVLRLGLIGGGLNAKRAAELMAAYAADCPLSETQPKAAKVLERLFCGNPPETQGKSNAS
jgi:tail tube GTA-gp10-like protein